MRPNKLEYLYLAITFQSSLTFVVKPGAYPRKKHMKGAPMLGTCPSILRPDWKGFPRTDPLAYWASLSVTKEKSFITLTPGSPSASSGSNSLALNNVKKFNPFSKKFHQSFLAFLHF